MEGKENILIFVLFIYYLGTCMYFLFPVTGAVATTKMQSLMMAVLDKA